MRSFIEIKGMGEGKGKREKEKERRKETESYKERGKMKKREKWVEFRCLKLQDTACPTCSHDTGLLSGPPGAGPGLSRC